MSIEAVSTFLNLIADQLENMWIDRDAFGEALFKNGFKPEQIKKLSDDAQADPKRRERARQAYAQLRASLLEAGKLAGIEALSEEPPIPGEPN